MKISEHKPINKTVICLAEGRNKSKNLHCGNRKGETSKRPFRPQHMLDLPERSAASTEWYPHGRHDRPVLWLVWGTSVVGFGAAPHPFLLCFASAMQMVRLTPAISFLPPAYPGAPWYKKQEHHMSKQTSSPRLTLKSSFLVKRNDINAQNQVRTN